MERNALRGLRRLALGLAAMTLLGLAACAGPQPGTPAATENAAPSADAAELTGPGWQRVHLGNGANPYDLPV
jgi:hypothetical protein